MRRVELLILGLVLANSACTTVHSAYLTNLSAPAQSARPIQAEAGKTVFLAMNFSNDYAYEARERLYAECPDGTVTGVLSTYETTWYVLFIRHEVTARAYCVPRPAAPAAPDVPEAPTVTEPEVPNTSPPIEVEVPVESNLHEQGGSS
ncbi:MAG: hypothetical protein IPG45_20695 [Deltaproteobacteria bacterium]|jgi:hypothetical protein|nr:hypothetical protein [Deltaproteobacteria bacterium]